jgi:hypothetical protein
MYAYALPCVFAAILIFVALFFGHSSFEPMQVKFDNTRLKEIMAKASNDISNSLDSISMDIDEISDEINAIY